MPNVLVVDDESLIRWSLRHRLEAAGHHVIEAATGADALERFREGVDLVILDYRLPDISGGELVKQFKALDPEPPVILLTAHASILHAVDAMKDGAYYYAEKTLDLKEVPSLVEHALETTRMTRELRTLLAREREAYGLDNLVGAAESIRAVKRLVRRVAERSATVLLTGESGTGKDLVARALHAESARAGGPFMNITCSALPDTLLENELFGHERGAFTDAQRQKRGLLEQANGGTVFLDEIGDVSLGVQAKLLRFLEEKTFRRLGGAAEIRPDVRVVAATNRDLTQAVRDGAFREDLLYRLSVVDIPMPPLRDRDGDVRILTQYFVQRFNKELRTTVTGVTDAALRKLETHWWPGNVRELRNTLERAMLLFDCDVLDVEHLKIAEPVRKGRKRYDLPVEGVDFRDIERGLVETALLRTRGNQSRAAALLHMTRDQIRHRMTKFGIYCRRGTNTTRRRAESLGAAPLRKERAPVSSVSPFSVLTLNGGSSSIRFALYETGKALLRRQSGRIERIGSRGAQLIVEDAAGKRAPPLHVPGTDYRSAVEFLLDWLEAQPLFGSVEAVGHRVVHGMKHAEPERITKKLVSELRRITPYDPDHLPSEVALIEAVSKRHPRLPQVACFDTAFHRTMPSVAKTLPLPRRYSAKGVERYGFHGLSYAYLMEELARLDRPESKGRVILAHLGNGASLAAVRGGKSIDTSMGFTPTAGLVMSTRTGDLDPGVAYYLARTERLTASRLQRIVNHDSGLLGVSGTSSDVRDLLATEKADPRAKEALDLFCYTVKKWIGAYAAALGGVGTLVFAAGIGENAPAIRKRICDGLGFLGIDLDPVRNRKSAPLISSNGSRVKVRVIRTNEELMLARSVVRVLKLGPREKRTR